MLRARRAEHAGNITHLEPNRCRVHAGARYLVLDSKIYKAPLDQSPLFHFNTNDIAASYRFMQEQGVTLVGEIEHDHYFLFKDPDGNLLMVCKC